MSSRSTFLSICSVTQYQRLIAVKGKTAKKVKAVLAINSLTTIQRNACHQAYLGVSHKVCRFCCANLHHILRHHLSISKKEGDATHLLSAFNEFYSNRFASQLVLH